MKVSVKNEYGQLKTAIVGRATKANWPTGDIYFDRMMKLSTYDGKTPKGKVPEVVIEEAEYDLITLRNVLRDNGVEVFRPEIVDWSIMTSSYGHTATGMHTYSARDLLLSVDDMVIECPTPFISRQHEFQAYDVIKQQAMRDGCRWIAAPRARMETAECVLGNNKINLTERYPIFDAANVMKFDDKLLYLKSSTANQAGAEWLQKIVGTSFEVIVWEGVYAHAHIDSTIISLAKDTVLINSTRVTDEQLPNFMKDYRKIWVKDCAKGKFHKFPYASKWIGMNILSINPETVLVDPIQKDLIAQLQQEKFKVIKVPLRQARTLGGGLHCVTNDLERE